MFTNVRWSLTHRSMFWAVPTLASSLTMHCLGIWSWCRVRQFHRHVSCGTAALIASKGKRCYWHMLCEILCVVEVSVTRRKAKRLGMLMILTQNLNTTNSQSDCSCPKRVYHSAVWMWVCQGQRTWGGGPSAHCLAQPICRTLSRRPSRSHQQTDQH